MPFTDQELATTMKEDLVSAGVMTAAEQTTLLENPTETNVRATLTQAQLDHFPAYWAELGTWMAAHDGDISQTKGTNVPGRVGGNPTQIAFKVLYNDAFWDVTQHIGTPGFLPVKAVSNELRFVAYFLED